MPKAKQAAFKALALDDKSAEAHTSLAYIKLIYDWDWRSGSRVPARSRIESKLSQCPPLVCARADG
jgi:hypothetical protein